MERKREGGKETESYERARKSRKSCHVLSSVHWFLFLPQVSFAISYGKTDIWQGGGVWGEEGEEGEGPVERISNPLKHLEIAHIISVYIHWTELANPCTASWERAWEASSVAGCAHAHLKCYGCVKNSIILRKKGLSSHVDSCNIFLLKWPCSKDCLDHWKITPLSFPGPLFCFIFLHSTYHCLTLHCFFIYHLSPLPSHRA